MTEKAFGGKFVEFIEQECDYCGRARDCFVADLLTNELAVKHT